MVALLKQKAKMGLVQRSRKQHEVAEVIKRIKGNDGSAIKMSKVENKKSETEKKETKTKIIKPTILEKYDEVMEKK